jgi:hypothetical protein
VQHSCNVKDFVHETRQNRMKLGRDQKVKKPKGRVQKIFQTLSSKFIKGFNKSWHKFRSFCMDGGSSTVQSRRRTVFHFPKGKKNNG